MNPSIENHYYNTNANIKMPRMLYGTAWKKQATASLVAQALLAGFRGIDTACQPKHYFEPGVGEGIEKVSKDPYCISRSDIFIQTKFTSIDGQDPNKIPYDPKANLNIQVQQSFQTSLKNLKTTYLDSLVLHSPMRRFSDTLIVWREFESLFQAGKVRQLGLSNCYKLEEFEQLWQQAVVKPAVLQNRFYPETGYDKELREFCRRNNVIYQSFWTLSGNPRVLKSSLLQSLAEKRGVSPEQIFYRFCIEESICVLNGTTSADHMQQDLKILDWTLDPNEVAAIRDLLH